MIRACSLCPRRCRALRPDTATGNGICRMPAYPTVARAALHFGEEPCLSGTKGSGTVFFSGCPLHCVFCQNHSISQDGFGETVSPARLSEIFRELVEQGAHNINLVSPTPFVPSILEALHLYRPPVPVVYNSSGYERPETLRALSGLVDVFLPDLKYTDPALAGSLSGAADYPVVARHAIREMAAITGPVVLDENGLIRRGTIVRHLVLPGHTHDSMATLRWLAEQRLPVYLSLLFQYTPMGNPADPALRRRLTRRECDKMIDFTLSLGLEDGYFQERTSSGTAFIPAFDLTGVRKAPCTRDRRKAERISQRQTGHTMSRKEEIVCRKAK